MKRHMNDKRWILWDLNSDFPFTHSTRKEAEKNMKIYNKEMSKFDNPYHLYKLIK